MKIELLTIYQIINYGSILQTYATQKIITSLGYDCEVLQYITKPKTFKKILFSKNRKSNSNLFIKIPFNLLRFFSLFIKKISFYSFKRKYIKLSKKKYITAEDIEKDIPKADIYVVGSDQVWNSFYNEGIDKGYFLTFVPHNYKKIAFVSSFGKSKLELEEKNIVKKYLKDFTALSVREENAVKILSDLGYSSQLLIDPTLQINKKEWLQIASKRLVKEKYVLLFIIYNEDNGATDIARYIANKKGLKLVKLSWELIRDKRIDKLFSHRKPEDFLSLFANAEFIVTNSFHGTAFAINFNKQFIVVERTEFNSRIDSLLMLTNLQSRKNPIGIIDSRLIDNYLENNIEYNNINKKIKIESAKAKIFLETAINE